MEKQVERCFPAWNWVGAEKARYLSKRRGLSLMASSFWKDL